MFCPRCGQQCLMDVRFCSRCGLPLNVIAEVTANQGMPTGSPGPTSYTPTRPRGLRIGTIIMLVALVLTPLFFCLSIAADGPAPLLVPLTVFLTGLCFVLYSRAFKDDLPVQYKTHQHRAMNPKNPSLLVLPDRSTITSSGPRKVNTADMVEPSSVTDHTTQFFD